MIISSLTLSKCLGIPVWPNGSLSFWSNCQSFTVLRSRTVPPLLIWGTLTSEKEIFDNLPKFFSDPLNYYYTHRFTSMCINTSIHKRSAYIYIYIYIYTLSKRMEKRLDGNSCFSCFKRAQQYRSKILFFVYKLMNLIASKTPDYDKHRKNNPIFSIAK